MGSSAIEVDHVSKAYRLYPTPRHRALELITFGTKTYHTNFWALADVSFRIAPGATLGLVGNNGSGKSTLLQLIAGIMVPTNGHIAVNGRVSSLLELGAGFNPEFTGRENVELYCIVMGMSREETMERLPAIQAFAGIGEFIDRPVKSYSSGMFVRLAFAAAIHVSPDILLVDEALAVGDVLFQHQCIRRIREMQASGTTIVFVSHDMGMMRSICTEAILLERGRIEAHDDPATIANIYHAKTANIEAAANGGARPRRDGDDAAGVVFREDSGFDERVRVFRHGTGAARIRQVELLDLQGRPLNSVEFDDEVILRVHVQYYEDAAFSILGFSIRDKTGTDIVGSNKHEENVPLPPRLAGSTVVVDFRQRLPLANGTYSVSTALAYDRSKPSYFDWVDNALVITVLPPESGKVVHGKVSLPVSIAVHAQ